MASYSVPRIALCAGLVVASVHPASAMDAGSQAGGGAPASDGSGEPTEDQEEPAEPAEEEPGEAEPREAEPVEAPVPEPRLLAPAPPAEAVPPTTEYPPGRADFMRRLRNTAEDLERGKASEPTQVHTQGDVTVLTNVAVASAEPRAIPPPQEPSPSPTLAEAVAEPVEQSEAFRDEVPSSNAPSSARSKDDSASWHWLWALVGVATVLLVPITRLLTRATRSS